MQTLVESNIGCVKKGITLFCQEQTVVPRVFANVIIKKKKNQQL